MSRLTRITSAGQPCRHCKTPVVDVDKSQKKPKDSSAFYYTGYFRCPNKKCYAIYLDPKRKVLKLPLAPKKKAPNPDYQLIKDASKLLAEYLDRVK